MRFFTWGEIALGAFGFVLAALAGIAQPLLPLAFGGLTTSFTGYSTSTTLDPAALAAYGAQLDDQVSKNLKLLFGLGAGSFVTTCVEAVAAALICSFAFVTIFSLQAERVTNRIRVAYLAALLRSNTAYFDALSAGQVVSRITVRWLQLELPLTSTQVDTNLIAAGIGEKFARLGQYGAQFFVRLCSPELADRAGRLHHRLCDLVTLSR